MKTFSIVVIALLFSFSLHSQTIHQWYQDGIIVFQLKTNSEFNIPSKNKVVDFEKIGFLSSLKQAFGIFHVTQLHPNDPDKLLRLTYQIEFEQLEKVDELAAELERLSFIEYAEKKELHVSFLTPNDLGANSSSGTGVWHLYRMNAQQAWDLSTGSSAVKVAITDDAIRTTHVDLTNKIVASYDAPTGGTNPNPCGTNNGNHGTHVSGTAGAQTNNATGIASIGFNVSLMAVKIGNCNGSLTHGYEGINWAANNGANVINMSWGGAGFSTYGQNVCNAALNAGAILVAAAGNDGTSQQFYPAAYTSVIAVASTTTNDAKSSFSQYGTWVDIAAPGSAIYSTYATSNTGYSRIQGTSMASPNVAGLIGLMKSYAPNVSNQDIVNCIYSSAANINNVNANFIGQLGAGRIDAYQALLCLQQYNVAVDAGITAITSPTTTVCSGSFTPTVTLRNFGQNPLTSVAINYEWNGSPATFNWTGNLATGQTTQVNLPAQTGPSGTYTFIASTSNPNGVADQNSTNNQTSVAFTMDPNGQTVNLTITTDCYGDEVTWNIRNDANVIVASGGPFANSTAGNTNNYAICLPVGCYTFNIFDSYGDGMYGSQWQSCTVNGNYVMTNSSGTLFQMTATNADFGSTTSHNFCITAPNIQNDAGIAEVISPQGVVCNSSVTPVVELRNYGSNPLTSALITYNAGGTAQTFNWTGNLNSGSVVSLTLPAISVAGGNTVLTVASSLPNGVADQNPSNNQSTGQFTAHLSPLTLPFVETFENNPFTTGGWVVENPDNEFTWEIATIGGTTPGNKAAKMNFFQYVQPSRRDGMISPTINFAGFSTITMTFEHAYRRFDQSTTDSLIVYVSTNCGQTYQRVFARGENGTGTFATATTSNQPFTPAASSDWCMGTVGSDCYSIDLSSFAGQQVIVKIEGFNSGTVGNNLFVDNINIEGVPAGDPPTASFTSGNTSICAGQTVAYSDQSSSNITAWNWSFPGGSPATSTQANPLVSYPNAGTYSVTLQVTNANGTNSTTSTNYVSVNALPAIPTISQNGNTLTAQATGMLNYQWFLNGVAIPGATASTLVINQSGLYSVTVTNSNGCSRNSTNFNPSFASIAENGFLPVQIFPNPTTGNFTLSYDDGAEVEIRSITDAYGKQVKYEVQETHGGIIIDLASVSQGVYFVNYTLQDGFFTHRVSVQW
jgi:PKD repeat protein